ncbi:hypothetical protein [Wansuia hejianensis]|uniref:Uncharacterized protein n=1 Tax=Wansuia hejianensis TaxID=2763667 RepID=A0A926EWK8_9FIRM|nr:hypothetical protein [Wansuia hejianensis]MBC8589658.1 hypothetical protein [Wansuia hejianensis]
MSDSGILDLIAIIISPIISFIVLFLTLKHDKKQFKIQTENQRNEHHETIDIMVKQHEQELDKQTEINRIAFSVYHLH